MKYFRYLFLILFFGLFSFMSGLTVSRHLFLGGTRLQGKEEIIIFLSTLLSDTIKSLQGILITGLFVEKKQDINPKQFNVPGLYPYLTKEGWGILDQGIKSSKFIPIQWEKLNELTDNIKESDSRVMFVNGNYPLHPIKLGNNIIFSNGNHLCNYNFLKKSFQVYAGIKHHHSIELVNDSLLYACSYGLDTLPYLNDALLIFNIKKGKKLLEKSIYEILIENNYKALLLGSKIIYTNWKLGNDLLHLNDVQPIKQKTSFADPGDVLISLNANSTVFLYRPKTNKILWLSQGPWIHQHDVDVLSNDEIGIYNNNVLLGYGFYKNDVSNVITYNFKTNKYSTLHKSTFEKYQIKSKTGSRFEILDNGNMFVEDSPSGAYYLIDSKGKLLARKSFPYKNNLTFTGGWARPYTSNPN